MGGTVTIYALYDSIGSVRYIGQTRYVEQRRAQHGKVWPDWTMIVLREVEAGQANEVEQRIIAEHEAAGCVLANWVHTERARRRMQEVARQRRRGGVTDTVLVTLRLTRAQHARLRALAEADSRSLHGQIVHFINEGIGRQEQGTGERAGDNIRAVR